MSTAAPAATPAVAAAQNAQDQINECLKVGKSFRLDAGAGAGKTYSLVEALKSLIKSRGLDLLRNRQQIACITYTNVACEEILSRIGRHPAVSVSTIHAFCWASMSRFQPFLRAHITSIEGWPERLAEAGLEINGSPIEYELGYPSVSEQRIVIGHNDVIILMGKLMAEAKFRDVLAARYPVLFVDEYQDTNNAFAAALTAYVLGKERSPLVGLFGDHWQKIYPDGCGKIEHAALVAIDKGSNFRSAPAVVNFLNHLRSELPQAVNDPLATGSVIAYHTNEWPGGRLTSGHWKEDLPPTETLAYFQKLRTKLAPAGWNFDNPKETKILMLTNAVLGQQQNYPSFHGIFKYPDSYLKKENPVIKFLVEVVEPACEAFEAKRYGAMFDVIGNGKPVIANHAEKQKWAEDMTALLTLRKTGTIDAVIRHLEQTRRPQLPEKVAGQLADLITYQVGKKKRAKEGVAETDETQLRPLDELEKLLAVGYPELSALRNYIEDKTPFSTKHGVKGQEFADVLVVFGRGWSNYNFNQMIEWYANGVPNDKADTFARNRNLFYVSCSRPKRRLAMLFTQKLSATSLAKLQAWLGTAAVISLGPDPTV